MATTVKYQTNWESGELEAFFNFNGKSYAAYAYTIGNFGYGVAILENNEVVRKENGTRMTVNFEKMLNDFAKSINANINFEFVSQSIL